MHGIKLCECGCGKAAPVSEHTDVRRGVVKGEPLRFVHNHHRRKPANGALILPGGKTVVLTIEGIRDRTYHCFLDVADYPLIKNYRWSVDKGLHTFYARCISKRISMHRLLVPGATDVDHRDGNGLNNRRNNLRPASRSQNSGNARPRRGGTSKYKGVTLTPAGAWEARISPNGKTVRLGTFKSQTEAARAYDAASLKYFGEFARLNFPTEGL
jgi:AP2 domain/HNH endonuclease